MAAKNALVDALRQGAVDVGMHGPEQKYPRESKKQGDQTSGVRGRNGGRHSPSRRSATQSIRDDVKEKPTRTAGTRRGRQPDERRQINHE